MTECNKLMKSVRFGRYQYELEGVAGIRKVIEPTSDSVVWTTLAALPSEVVNFREDCIMNLQGSSPTACHLRIWFQVYAESFSLSPEAHEGLASVRLKGVYCDRIAVRRQISSSRWRRRLQMKCTSRILAMRSESNDSNK